MGAGEKWRLAFWRGGNEFVGLLQLSHAVECPLHLFAKALAFELAGNTVIRFMKILVSSDMKKFYPRDLHLQMWLFQPCCKCKRELCRRGYSSTMICARSVLRNGTARFAARIRALAKAAMLRHFDGVRAA
jgi:hypothetical protein